MKPHPKLIIFDLDGVIFRGQYLLRLSRHLGLLVYLRNLFKCLLYDMGMLPIDTLLGGVYRGFKGMPMSTVRQVYDEMPLIAGAKETVKGLKARGCEVIIVSSGVPDFLVRDIAERLGADLGFGLEAAVSGDALSGEVGGVLANAGGKDAFVERLLRDKGLGWEEAVVVADDPNNLNIMEKAGISVGVNACYTIRRSATFLVDSGDLREVVDLLAVGYKAADVWEHWLQDARRKLIHVFAAAVPFAAGLAPTLILVSLCVAIAIYSISEWIRLNGKIFPLVGHITVSCIRSEEKRYFVLAPITLTLGIIISLILFSYEVSVAVILILAFADSAAALAGRAWGTRRIPYNRSKSLQGSMAAFMVACLCTAIYFPIVVSIAAAFVSTFIESLPIGDDNITIPVGTGIVLTTMVG